MTINLQVEDERDGRVHVICLSHHNANKLYKALQELFGDAQFMAKPGELITMPKAHLKIK